MNLSNDAKAILMLCGRFGDPRATSSVKPLSLGEYNQLAQWMQGRDLRPENLLTDNGLATLIEAPAVIEGARIRQLLSRGASMAFAIEKWSNAGVWVVCRSDLHYPDRLKRHLKKQAPPILYGIGDRRLLIRGGLAVVGSRNVDALGAAYTREVAEACARQRVQIISGGARGVDETAMLSALDTGGEAVGVLADSLLKAAVAKRYRAGIRDGRLALVSAYSPDARFNVGQAMGRNKYIYALADYALIISAEVESGGTWADATEELKRDHPRPVYVRMDTTVPKGNQALIQLGANPFPLPPWDSDLTSKLSNEQKPSRPSAVRQLSLFGENVETVSSAYSVNDAAADYTARAAQSDGEKTVERGMASLPPSSNSERHYPPFLNALISALLKEG